MENLNCTIEGTTLNIRLSGRIDSTNAAEAEREIVSEINNGGADAAVIDCGELNYISSAGLRVILRIKKTLGDTKLINVSPDVYEIFDMTGFTEMMEVQKAYRTISVEGCEVIGQGANGRVYRLDRDTIVKAYINNDALPEIHRERELARTAFVLGIPTAIPYDVVRIKEGGYGSVFEGLNAKSYAKLLTNGEKTVDEIARMSVDLLKIIHGTVVAPGTVPDMKQVALGWAEFLCGKLPEDTYQKLYELIRSVPESRHLLHGDYHIKNVMVQNGESLLIDMDTVCCGHPVFEFASIYNAYVGFGEVRHEQTKEFLGITYECAGRLWKKILELYFKEKSAQQIAEIEKKAMIVGYTRIMRRTIRRGGENAAQIIALCKDRLIKLVGEVDTLTF